MSLAQKGHLLSENDMVVTGEKAVAVIRSKKLILKMIEKSSITIKEIREKIIVDIETGGAVTQYLGNKLKNALSPELEVKTKHTSMGVRGTTFFAFNHKNQTSYLTVKEGEVEFKAKNSDEKLSVRNGNTTFTDTLQKGVKPKKVGFEEYINWELNDTKKDLSQPRQLFAKLDVEWNQYKKENEKKWKDNNDSMEDQWKKFKNQP